uniref:Uncharacterized protein n=1 Tax=Romanomermis culicivorax TaxID=13658 RepID=A0A915KRE9_ROMCU
MVPTLQAGKNPRKRVTSHGICIAQLAILTWWTKWDVGDNGSLELQFWIFPPIYMPEATFQQAVVVFTRSKFFFVTGKLLLTFFDVFFIRRIIGDGYLDINKCISRIDNFEITVVVAIVMIDDTFLD